MTMVAVMRVFRLRDVMNKVCTAGTTPPALSANTPLFLLCIIDDFPQMIITSQALQCINYSQ